THAIDGPAQASGRRTIAKLHDPAYPRIMSSRYIAQHQHVLAEVACEAKRSPRPDDCDFKHNRRRKPPSHAPPWPPAGWPCWASALVRTARTRPPGVVSGRLLVRA